MAATVARKMMPRDGGRFTEAPIVVAAEPLMNCQAVLDVVRKFNARQARIERASAAERERLNGAISSVLENLREAVAATERSAS